MRGWNMLSRLGGIFVMLGCLILCPCGVSRAFAQADGGVSVALRQVVRFRSTQGVDVAVYVFSDGGIVVRRAEAVSRPAAKPDRKDVPEQKEAGDPSVLEVQQSRAASQEARHLAALVADGVSLTGGEAVQALAHLGIAVETAPSGLLTVLSLAPGAVMHSQERFAPDAGEQTMRGKSGESEAPNTDENGEALHSEAEAVQSGEGAERTPDLPFSPNGSAWGAFDVPVTVTGEEGFAGDALNGKPISR